MKGNGLEIQIEDRAGVRLVHITGPLDSETHDQFRNQLDPIVRPPRVRIVLDCEKLTYVNSRGIMLLAHYQRATGLNLSFFGIAALNPRILKGIELLGMSTMIKPYPTVAEAMQAAATL
jgi:anti-anti-sigma factor